MQNMFWRLHFKYFFRRFHKSKNITRIMSHSVTIWRNVNVVSFFAPDNVWASECLRSWSFTQIIHLILPRIYGQIWSEALNFSIILGSLSLSFSLIMGQSFSHGCTLIDQLVLPPTVGHLRAVGTRPYYQAADGTLSKKTFDRLARSIAAASGKQGCTL